MAVLWGKGRLASQRNVSQLKISAAVPVLANGWLAISQEDACSRSFS